MASLKFILNKRANKDGEHAIYLRLTHKRKPTKIKTGIAVFYEEWNSDAEKIVMIKNGSLNIKKLNIRLSRFLIEKNDIIDELKAKGKLNRLNVAQLRKIVSGNLEKESVFTFWRKFIDEVKHFNKLNTKIYYESCFNSFKEFRGNEDMFFEDIDYSLLCKYSKWFNDRNVTINGCRGRLTNLKTIYNEAKKHDVCPNELNPFLHFKIQKTPSKKKALSKEKLGNIISFEVDENSKLGIAKDIFLISYYACGIPFVDLVKLKYENIDDGFIYYNRSKTKTAITIPLTSKIKDALRKYFNENDKVGYIFPFISTEEPKKFHYEYLSAQRSYSSYLSLLGEKCGLKNKLTPYICRHTSATLMIHEYKVPIHVVATLFGHSTTKMTETYVASIDKHKLIDYLDVI